MRRNAERPSACAVVVHDVAVLAALFYTPILWGAFNAGGQAFAAALVGVAALAALGARWAQGRAPAVVPNAIHLPALMLLGISAVSALFSVSRHASALELTRLAIGVALFFLIANRSLLPAPPARAVGIAFACTAPIILAARTLIESRFTPALLADPDFLTELVHGPGAVLRLLTLVALALVSALIIAERSRPDPFRWWIAAVVASGALAVAGYGLREKVFLTYVMNNPSWSIFSTFFNPNPLAGFLGMVAFLALGGMLAEQAGARRAAWAAAAALLAAAIAVTNSKGAWIALAVSAIVFALLLAGASARPRRNLGLLAGAGALALLVVGAGLATSPGLRARAVAAVSAQRASNMFRLLTWQGTLRMAAAHPLLGIGPGGFKYTFMKYAVGGYTEAAHQNYLQVAAEQGFPGLVVFLWLLGGVFLTGRRALARATGFAGRALSAAALCALCVLALHSLLDYDWYIGAIGLLFWFLAGLLAYQASGRELVQQPVGQEQSLRPRRRGARQQTRPPAVEERGVRRLPWPVGLAGRAMVTAGLAGVLLLCLLIPARNGCAQAAMEEASEAANVAYQSLSRDRASQASLQAVVDHYRRAVQCDPGWARAWESYGLALGAVKRTREGEQAIRLATRLEPTSFQPYLTLARFYEDLGRFPEAVSAYQGALARYPNSTRALRKLAQGYQRLGDPPRALATYRRMIEIEASPYNRYRALEEIDVDTEYAYAHYQLGRAAAREFTARRGRAALEEGVRELEAALRVVAAYHERGKRLDEMFKNLGRPREERAESLTMLEARARWRLAPLYQALGRLDQAARERARAQELMPDVARACEFEDGGSTGL